MVSVFKALADLTRLRIVSLLNYGDLCVGEIEYLLGVSQTSVSQHLERLRHVGLVTSRRQSQWVYYSLSRNFIEERRSIGNLIAGEISGTSESNADTLALQRYRESGMTCLDLPNCKRSQRPKE